MRVAPTEIWRMGANPVPLVATADFARRFEAAGWDGFAVAEAAGIIPDPYIATEVLTHVRR